MYSSLVEWAVTQIGVHNDPDGSNKYNEWYYGYRSREPWCAVFQARGFWEVGIYDRLDGLVNKAGCEPWRRWAIQKGYWSTKPKVGALVLYDWNPDGHDGADHIGVVESIFNGGIVAIEGNTSPDSGGSQTNGGWVARKTRYNNKIMGYIHVDTKAKRPEPNPVIGFSRISGKDRYNTSKATANTVYNNGAVTLVSGKNFADALSASYFSRQMRAPIILTSESVEEDTVKYIKERRNIQKIYIIGGYGAVPESIEKKLEGYTIERYAGSTRYETNLSVLHACKTPNKQLVIASGQNFPDGMCASMIDRPVMLVNKRLNDDQERFIRERGLNRFYVIGGESVVSKNVYDKLSTLGEPSRYAGDIRYATSRAVAKAFFPLSETVVLASGKDFADGVSAVNLGSYPLVLVDDGFTGEARKYLTTCPLKKVYVVGGKGVLSDYAVDWALTKIGSERK